jgi:hypothetical protein
MPSIAVSLSAFSARATRGRRAVLLGYSGLVTLLLLGLAKLIAVRAAEDGDVVNPIALADMFAMMLTAGALFVVGPAMVASQVAEERRSGTLDLLRTAPLSPTALAAGFLVGAPASMYLLCAGPLALHLGAGLIGAIPLPVVVHSLFLIPLGAAAAMLLAMLLAVSVGREGGGAAPLLVAGLLGIGTLATVGMASGPDLLPWAFVHPAGALAALYQTFDGPYRQAFSSPWRIEQMAEPHTAAVLAIEPAVAIGVYAAGCVLLLSAARRVLAAEVRSRLTKPTALAVFALAALALLLPLRAIIPAQSLAVGHLGVIAFFLTLPFFACVLGATSSALDPRAPRLSVDGAPHATGALMIASLGALLALLYSARPFELIVQGRDAWTTLGLVLLALTVPIYARWAATRLTSNAGRMAFWALITVHLCLQVPSIAYVAHDHRSRHDISFLLAQLDLLLGVVLPLVLWQRQRVADRAAAALAV